MSERQINPILKALEYHTELGPTFAARVLGVAYPTYAQYRSGRRVLPTYHHRHIQALMGLQPAVLALLIEEHAHGNSTT